MKTKWLVRIIAALLILLAGMGGLLLIKQKTADSIEPMVHETENSTESEMVVANSNYPGSLEGENIGTNVPTEQVPTKDTKGENDVFVDGMDVDNSFNEHVTGDSLGEGSSADFSDSSFEEESSVSSSNNAFDEESFGDSFNRPTSDETVGDVSYEEMSGGSFDNSSSNSSGGDSNVIPEQGSFEEE